MPKIKVDITNPEMKAMAISGAKSDAFLVQLT
jgi:hypothetical protein